MQNSTKKDWLHVYDSGGTGTRGLPDYDNAAFYTKIHMQPSPIEECELEGLESHRGLLYSKFIQPNPGWRVFDFQVGFDIADNPTGFSFFLFRWKEGDRIFSARTGFGFRGSDPAPAIDFLGDDKDIRDSTIDRTFRISGAKVIASEHDGKKVIAALSCDNLGEYDVTVHGTS
jgi:hypothetical protein